ncbi:MAG TPA: serine/threonine-protein kinase [Ktedonobacteraceae bacterium]|jgi:serine/threonine protein kinase
MSAESRRLGKYELRERLGSGGQGEVWKAFDVQLRRFVAIKRLNAHLQVDPDFAARFEREARFIASLHHPNIMQIHDFQFEPVPGSDTSTAYMVMDFIDGPTLADYIRNTSRKRQYPPASDIVSIFTSVSLALDYAHQKGVLHRDIKPANIMLDMRNSNGKPMGEPILTDFGIAKLQGGSAETTRVLGTPLYVSPEQAQGFTGDKHSDLYSLGIILYEIMTGFPPFSGATPMAVLLQHYQETPRPPDLLNPDISPELSTVILKSIAKEPNARFSSASAMTIALAEALHVPVSPELRKATKKSSITNEPGTPNPLSLPPEMQPTLLKSSLPSPAVTMSPLAFVPSAGNKQTSTTPPEKRPEKKIFIVLLALLAALGLGVASYALFALQSRGRAPAANTVVGQVVFRSSQNKAGDFDVAEITLKSIPNDTSDGKSYFVWLETHDLSAGSITHWSFTAHNGSISPSSYQHQDLLIPSPYLLLITHQSGGAVVPSFNLSDRLYYAPITQVDNAHTTFDIMGCPPSNSNNICFS